MPPRCPTVDPTHLNKAALLLHEIYAKESRYGPLDRLGHAKSREAVLVALYEALRGLDMRMIERSERLKEAYESLKEVVNAIISGLERDDCFERAVRTANALGVKALAPKAGG